MLRAASYLLSRYRLSPMSMPEAAITSSSVYRSIPVTSMRSTRKNSVSAATTAPQITSTDSSL